MGGTLTFFLSLLIVVRHLGLVWKMKLATVVLALVLFVSQASAELEPVLLAVQEKATYKSKVVNETLLPYAIEALIEEKEDYYPRYKQNHYEDGEKEQEEDEKKEQEDKKKDKKKNKDDKKKNEDEEERKEQGENKKKTKRIKQGEKEQEEEEKKKQEDKKKEE